MKKTFTSMLLIVTAVTLSACSVTTPIAPDTPAPKLHDCPPTPNCSSTEAMSSVHQIKPFVLKVPINQAWTTISQVVSDMPRTEIKVERPGYLYAKSYSKIFHFVDYLEVLSVPEENRLAVRSSSMLGISDLGVNAKRTAALRRQLEQRNIIQISD